MDRLAKEQLALASAEIAKAISAVDLATVLMRAAATLGGPPACQATESLEQASRWLQDAVLQLRGVLGSQAAAMVAGALDDIWPEEVR